MRAGQAWGISAIAFGCWEATAYSTRRLPTVSRIVWWSLGCRHRRAVRVLVVAYLLGMARHLLTPEA